MLRHVHRSPGSATQSSALTKKLQRVHATAIQSPPRLSLGETLRSQFPILEQQVNGKPLVYLDSAATSQKPQRVIDALNEYYSSYNSNVHRGVHYLSAKATTAYEESRDRVAKFINAESSREVVFTRNASEAINLVAYSWGMTNLKPGDEIILSVSEHHSNLVPWQLVAQKTGAVLRHVKLTENGQELDMAHFDSLLGPKTSLISLVHVSNMLGAVLDVEHVSAAAKKVGAKLLLDCCQSVPHMPVDVQALGADWIVASSHKIYGPTGIGFLWGRMDVLEGMPPWMGGGEMIADVFLNHSTYAAPPSRFEAGTPAIGEAIGMGVAIEWLSEIGMDKVSAHETEVGTYLYERLSAVPGVTVYGPPPSHPRGRAALCAFNVKGVHPTDLSTIIDASGVAIRSGHHCTQPIHAELGISSSARASLGVHSTKADVDAFISALTETISFFGDME